MKSVILLTLAAVAVALTLPSPPKPLWEVQLRLGGAPEGRSQQVLSRFFGLDVAAGTLGQAAVLHVAGLDNPATPGADWTAEVSGVADMPRLMSLVAARGQPESGGKFRFEQGGLTFVAWQEEGGSTLRLAGPPENAGAAFTPVVTLKQGAWLAAWIDLERVSREAIHSATLKLPQSVRLTATDTAAGTEVELAATLASAAMTDRARAVVDDLRTALAPTPAAGSAAAPLPVDVSVEGNEITVRVRLDEHRVGELLGEATIAPPGQ